MSAKPFRGRWRWTASPASLKAERSTPLWGKNGSGKSTLVKIMNGVHQATGGKILIDGQELAYATPAEAQAQGIATVYQELSLIPA